MYRLTKRQQAALANLEKAITRVGKSGLVIHGIDQTLNCYTSAFYEDFLFDKAPAELEDEQKKYIILINTNGFYIDSGGW